MVFHSVLIFWEISERGGRCIWNICYNHKTKYTDWCPIPKDGGWGICLRMSKPVKELVLKFLNNSRVYKTQSVKTFFFPLWTSSTSL